MITPKGRMKGLAPFRKRVKVNADGTWQVPLPAGRFTSPPVRQADVEKAADNTRTYDHGMMTPKDDAEAMALVRGKVTRYVQLKPGLIPSILGQERAMTEAIGTEVLYVNVTVGTQSV